MNYLEEAKQLASELKEIRRHIHSCPEAGKSLPATKAFVTDKLREYGYEPEEICESGIVAVLRGGQASDDSKTILLRADMDALPMQKTAGSHLPVLREQKDIVVDTIFMRQCFLLQQDC